MLGIVTCHEPRARSVQHGACGDHLGVNERTPAEQAVEEPAMPVRPFHHRGNAEFALQIVRTHTFSGRWNSSPFQCARRQPYSSSTTLLAQMGSRISALASHDELSCWAEPHMQLICIPMLRKS